MSGRPLHVARDSWQQISNELRTRALLARPKPTEADTLAEQIEIREVVTQRTMLSGKWVFLR